MSVVLPFRNAERTLAAQLRALATQDFTGAWEVIAVDNRSTDSSRQHAARFRGDLPLRLVVAPERASPAYARNVGARAARGRKLIFLDADDEADQGLVRALVAALDLHDLVACRLDHEALNPPWLRRAYGDHWQVEGVDPLFDFLPFAGAGTVGVTRQTFDLVGGFDEELVAGEDAAFVWDAQLEGVPLAFVPDAVLRLRYRDTLGGLFLQARGQGTALPLLYRRYRASGLSRRPLRRALVAWRHALVGLFRARRRDDLAQVAVQLGFLVGRLEGSIRHRLLAA